MDHARMLQRLKQMEQQNDRMMAQLVRLEAHLDEILKTIDDNDDEHEKVLRSIIHDLNE